MDRAAWSFAPEVGEAQSFENLSRELAQANALNQTARHDAVGQTTTLLQDRTWVNKWSSGFSIAPLTDPVCSDRAALLSKGGSRTPIADDGFAIIISRDRAPQSERGHLKVEAIAAQRSRSLWSCQLALPHHRVPKNAASMSTGGERLHSGQTVPSIRKRGKPTASLRPSSIRGRMTDGDLQDGDLQMVTLKIDDETFATRSRPAQVRGLTGEEWLKAKTPRRATEVRDQSAGL